MTRWRTWIVIALAAVLAGCASPYRSLVREDSLPDLKAAKAATIAREGRTVMAPTLGVRGPDLKIAVHELEAAATDRVLVFIHGVFADHETWRFVAGNLARDHGVWLVDLPGCGQSEAPSALREDTYTIPDVAERTLQALRYCLSSSQPPRIALVGHSYGAAVIIRMFSDAGLRDRYGDVLKHVDRLVLVSPLDIALNSPSPLYKQIVDASAFKVRLAAASGKLKRRIALATIASVPDADRALREEADKKIAVLRDGRRRVALQTMIARAVPWTDALRPDWDEIEGIEATYGQVDRETLIMVGTRDEALPASMSYKLAVQLRRSSFVPLKGVMHSPHIEVPETCATLIREFVTTGRVDADAMGARGEP